MITIILLIISLIVAIIIAYNGSRITNFVSMLITIPIFIIGVICTVTIVSIIYAISQPFQENSKPVIVENSRVYLNTVDADTLNGREYYLVANPDHSYTYVVKNENGDLEPSYSNYFVVREDEEVKPYLEKESILITMTQTSENTWWLLPFNWFDFKNLSHVDEDDYKTVFHVPTKSVKYYIDTETQVGE